MYQNVFCNKKGVNTGILKPRVHSDFPHDSVFFSTFQTRFRDQIHHYGLCQYDSRTQKVNQQH